MSRGKNSRRRMCSPLCVLIHRTLWQYCRICEAASRVTSLRDGMTWLGTSFRTAFQASWVVSILFTSIHSSMFSTRNSWRRSATSSARPACLSASTTSSGRHSGKVMPSRRLLVRARSEPYSSTTRRAALLSIGSQHRSNLFSVSRAKGRKSSCKRLTARDAHLCRVLGSRSTHCVCIPCALGSPQE